MQAGEEFQVVASESAARAYVQAKIERFKQQRMLVSARFCISAISARVEGNFIAAFEYYVSVCLCIVKAKHLHF